MTTLRQGSIRLFRLAGIDVFLHWSWFLVAAFEISGRAGTYSSVTWNILEYLALFLIVTLHEYGHALACRQVGGTADQIVLWPMGGVAYVDPPPRPGATLWSIVAGPLVNLVLLPLLTALGWLSRSLGWAQAMPNAHALLRAVWFINLFLLMFNILPIYPLDGGQILRSLLWFLVGRARSLMVAAIIGLIGAAGFVVLAAVDAIGLAWRSVRVHLDELLEWPAPGAGTVTFGKVAAPRMVCLSHVQDGPTRRRLLEVLAVQPAIRHIPNTSRLSPLRDAVCCHQVSGLWRTTWHRRMGRSLPCTYKGLAGALLLPHGR